MHVHTHRSLDSSTTFKALAYFADKRGLDGVAITDHDVPPSSVRCLEEYDLLVVPGTEISTRQGHVLAINPSGLIAKGLSFGETIDRIHDAPVSFYRIGVDHTSVYHPHGARMDPKGTGVGPVVETLDIRVRH